MKMKTAIHAMYMKEENSLDNSSSSVSKGGRVCRVKPLKIHFPTKSFYAHFSSEGLNYVLKGTHNAPPEFIVQFNFESLKNSFSVRNRTQNVLNEQAFFCRVGPKQDLRTRSVNFMLCCQRRLWTFSPPYLKQDTLMREVVH